MDSKIFNAINEKRLVKTFCDLVKIESLSMKEQRFEKHLIHILKGLKLDVITQKKNSLSNIIALKQGGIDKKPVLFNAHMDTVGPAKNIKPIIDNKIIRSSGDTILGADDKSAIAVYIEAIKVLKELKIPTIPVEFAFTCGEEIGLYGAKNLNYSLFKSNFGFCFDSDGDIGTVIVEAPFHITYSVDITGKASHAGIAPEKGINSIKIAAEIISKIKTGRIDHETTSNIGLINGGRATNIVPEFTNIKGEIRSRNQAKLNKLKDNIKSIIITTAKKYKSSGNIKTHLEYKGYKIKQNDPQIQLLKTALNNINKKINLIPTNGGSDSNIFISNKIKVMNLGIGMQKVHTKDEYIKIQNLKDAVKLVLSIILTLSER